MAKFHIVDTDLDIVDSSDNMLALRLSCADVNKRFYGIGDECVVMSSLELEQAKSLLHNYNVVLDMLDIDKKQLVSMAGDEDKQGQIIKRWACNQWKDNPITIELSEDNFLDIFSNSEVLYEDYININITV